MNLDFGEDIAYNEMQNMIKSGLPIVLFGFGGAVFRMYDELQRLGLGIKYIVDNNKQKEGYTWGTAKVISFLELKRIYVDCHIIITVSSYKYIEEIKQQIKKDGQFDKVYYFQMYYPFGNAAQLTIRNNMDKIEKVYDLLADVESKSCFENKLNFIMTKKEKFLICNSDEREYFPKDILNIKESEYFVDGGAFHGEDTEALKGYVKNLQAICIEPDRINYTVLTDNMKKYKGNNIRCINSAVWKEDGEIMFAESGSMGSTINDKGKTKVQTVSIDGLKMDKISFIKLDVEGAEIEALRGAVKTIKKYSPKMAVCVYHIITHHWDIPLFLYKINPNYKLYMRQHDQTGVETVCYAQV